MAEPMTDQTQEDDQSMEEILQSIRRIIAEDDDEGADDAPAGEESPAEEQNEEPEVKGSDILELTDMVTDDGALVNVSEDSDDLDDTNESAPLPAEDVDVQAEAEAPQHDVLADIDSALGGDSTNAGLSSDAFDSLVSDETAASASAMLKGLRKPAESVVESQYMPALRSGTTIEDLMIEALRPLLKNWLDTNLTDVVERIVEKEVKKLTQ